MPKAGRDVNETLTHKIPNYNTFIGDVRVWDEKCMCVIIDYVWLEIEAWNLQFTSLGSTWQNRTHTLRVCYCYKKWTCLSFIHLCIQSSKFDHLTFTFRVIISITHELRVMHKLIEFVLVKLNMIEIKKLNMKKGKRRERKKSRRR